MSNIRDIIRAAKLPEISKSVCLAGHLLAEIGELERQRQSEAGPESARKKAVAENRKIDKKIDELRDQMASATIDIRIRALPKDDWRSLIEKHPPRKGNKDDAEAGVHLEKFLDAVLRRSLFVDGELLSDEDFDALMQVMHTGEYEQLTGAVWALNRGAVVVPKSPRESRAAGTSDDD